LGCVGWKFLDDCRWSKTTLWILWEKPQAEQVRDLLSVSAAAVLGDHRFYCMMMTTTVSGIESILRKDIATDAGLLLTLDKLESNVLSGLTTLRQQILKRQISGRTSCDR
jgi:hypothetical protein